MSDISIVIPHYPINQEVDSLLKRCVDSLSDHKEIIVVVNEGTGFGKAVNTGVKISSGEYVVIMNNDCYISLGSILSLAKPDRVVSPVWGMADGPSVANEFMPSLFCIPVKLYDEIGGFDEDFKVGDYEDDDFYYRGIKKGIKFEYNTSVRVFGENGYTKDKMPGFYNQSKNNKNRFVDKWGCEPIKRISILV